MNGALLDLVLWILASPLLFVQSALRMARRIRFYRTAYAGQIPCRHCGAAISLVNLWRCPCGFTAAGHLLRECRNCGSLPRMVRCYECGATERLPDL